MNKDELLMRAGREWGLEDEATVEMYMMSVRGATYGDLLTYYDSVNSAIDSDWNSDF